MSTLHPSIPPNHRCDVPHLPAREMSAALVFTSVIVQYLHQNPETKIDWVLGAKQNPLARRTPQVVSCLQVAPVHPPLLQNTTLFVAARQFVPGTLRHVAPPVYTVHDPPQQSSVRTVLQ